MDEPADQRRPIAKPSPLRLIQFCPFPVGLLGAKDVRPAAQQLFAYLLMRDRSGGEKWSISHRILAGVFNTTPRVIRRWWRELRLAKWLIVTYKPGGQASYTINWEKISPTSIRKPGEGRTKRSYRVGPDSPRGEDQMDLGIHKDQEKNKYKNKGPSSQRLTGPAAEHEFLKAVEAGKQPPKRPVPREKVNPHGGRKLETCPYCNCTKGKGMVMEAGKVKPCPKCVTT